MADFKAAEGGFFGPYTDLATLQSLFPAALYAGRQALVGDPPPRYSVFSNGFVWVVPAGFPGLTPVNSVAPVITGDGTVGNYLNVSNAGTWTNSPTFTWHWVRNGALTKNARGSSYQVQAADVGASLTCIVIGTGTGAMVSAVSNAIVGVNAAGTGTQLALAGTAATGNVMSVVGAPGASTYQWQKNGVNIAGATSPTYTVQAGDGVNLRCLVNGVLSGPALYWGNVGTRVMLPQALSTSQSCNSRIAQVASEALTGIKLVYYNGYVTNFSNGATYVETPSGGSMSFAASIEYPAGTYTQMTFNNGALTLPATGSGNVTNASDIIAVNIPAGATYWVRTFCSNAAGLVNAGGTPHLLDNATFGDAIEVGATTTSVTNKTMGGTITDNGTGVYIGPAAILALTQRATILQLGDSRTLGENDTIGSAGSQGWARGLGYSATQTTAFGVMNHGVRGDSPQKWNASHAKRMQLAQYTSHAACDYGINSFITDSPARTGAQALADLQTVWNTLSAAGLPVFQSTISPAGVTSTDSYATPGNETAASYNVDRVTLNAGIRTTPTPLTRYIEQADTLDNTRDSGIFKTTGVANGYVDNSTHPLRAGYLLAIPAYQAILSAVVH